MSSDNKEPLLLGRFWEQIQSFFSIMFKDVWTDFSSFVPNLTKLSLDKILEVINSLDDPVWDATFDFMEKSGFLTNDQRKLYESFKGMSPLHSPLAWFIVVFSFIFNWVLIMNSSANDKMQQTIASQHLSTLPPMESLIRSAFIAPEKTDDIRNKLQKYGFGPEAQDYLFLSQYSLYDTNMCRELYLRGVIDKNKLFERMRELGFTDTRIEEQVQVFPVIPGPQDLFTLVGKEAFEPETITKFGLDKEFPEGQVKWLEKQGISRFWAEKYWAAHWYQPSIQQGMMMRHRDLITDSDMDLLFRAQELPPFWREKIKGITYLPYARVDLRRLWKSGVITDVEEIYTNYKWQGYDHEHSMNLTEFAIVDAEESERDITMGQLMDAYENKLMDRNTIKELLIDLRYSEEKAEFLILSKDYDIANEFLKDHINLIGKKYVNRLIDKFTAMRDLNLLNLPSEQTYLLMGKWDIELIKDVKLPSKTDIVKFYKAGIIKDINYLDSMDQLGYSSSIAGQYLQLTKIEMGILDKEIDEEDKLPSKGDLSKFFRNALITESEYNKGMIDLGFNSGYSRLYLELIKMDMTPEVIGITEDIRFPSRADLIKFYKAGKIDDNKFYSDMKQIGYNELYSKTYLDIIKMEMRGKEK